MPVVVGLILAGLTAIGKKGLEALGLWALDWAITAIASMFTATKAVAKGVATLPGIEVIPQLWATIPPDMRDLALRVGCVDAMKVVMAAMAARLTLYVATMGRI